ncbi:MAG: DNA translocase FtsK [Spirulinaceae cyanobacterium SM2_1_0]|nr:DNA translocase FtsK [Spirulinaceae cyanobacterium SM2_1_0]
MSRFSKHQIGWHFPTTPDAVQVWALLAVAAVLLAGGARLERGVARYASAVLSLTLGLAALPSVLRIEAERPFHCARRQAQLEGIRKVLLASPVPQNEPAIAALPPGAPPAAHAIIQAAADLGAFPGYAGHEQSHALIRLKFAPQSATEDAKLSRLPLKRLCGGEPSVVEEGGLVVIEVARPDRQFPHWRDYLSRLDQGEPGAFGVGIDPRGGLVQSTSQAAVHLLVAGATNSGKSVAMQSIAASLAYCTSPDMLRLYFCDPKRVTFRAATWEKLPHTEQIVTSREEAIGLLSGLMAIAQERYALIEQAGLENLYEYNQLSSEQSLPVMAAFFEEIAMFQKDGKLDPRFAQILEKCAAYVRAAGIMLVCSTQKPVDSILPTKVRANLPSRLGLRASNRRESKLIVEEDGCEKLLGKGDGLWSEEGGEPRRLQVPDGAKWLLDAAVQRWRSGGELVAQEPVATDSANRLNRLLSLDCSQAQPAVDGTIDPTQSLTAEQRGRLVEAVRAGWSQNQIVKELFGCNSKGTKRYFAAVQKVKAAQAALGRHD